VLVLEVGRYYLCQIVFDGNLCSDITRLGREKCALCLGYAKYRSGKFEVIEFIVTAQHIFSKFFYAP